MIMEVYFIILNTVLVLMVAKLSIQSRLFIIKICIVSEIKKKKNTLSDIFYVKLQNTNITIGQRERMSESDIIKLNKRYKCPGF